MSNFSWTCPFCQRDTTITSQDMNEDTTFLRIDNVEGKRGLTCTYIVCPNPECKKFALSVTLSEAIFYEGRGWGITKMLKTWQLIPPSKAQLFPDYIPKPILDGYEEACLIKDLSAKASATLARRCLQGIIRDFWEVKGKNLQDEINQIRDRVEPLTWDAINAVRTVGNIGAHMEKDIDLIIDVEPNEAELLIGLIEGLLKDWYIARQEKKSHLTMLVEIAKDKETAKKSEQDNL